MTRTKERKRASVRDLTLRYGDSSPRERGERHVRKRKRKKKRGGRALLSRGGRQEREKGKEKGEDGRASAVSRPDKAVGELKRGKEGGRGEDRALRVTGFNQRTE